MSSWFKKLLSKGDGGKGSGDAALPESQLTAEDLVYRQTAHHGPIDGACCMAHDAVLGLVAIGGEGGCIKVSAHVTQGSHSFLIGASRWD